MEVTKQMWENAVRVVRKVATEAAKVSAEAAPLTDQKKAFGATVRDSVAHMVALAFFRNIGAEGVTKAIGKNTIKATAEVLKSRLSEANKVRRLHPDWQVIAEFWAAQEFGGETEDGLTLPGISVREASKHPDVARPRDIFGALAKGVKVAALYGATLEDALEAVSRAYSETDGTDVDAVSEEAEEIAEAA